LAVREDTEKDEAIDNPQHVVTGSFDICQVWFAREVMKRTNPAHGPLILFFLEQDCRTNQSISKKREVNRSKSKRMIYSCTSAMRRLKGQTKFAAN